MCLIGQVKLGPGHTVSAAAGPEHAQEGSSYDPGRKPLEKCVNADMIFDNGTFSFPDFDLDLLKPPDRPSADSEYLLADNTRFAAAPVAGSS